MEYRVDPNAKNVWVRDNADTMDLSMQTDANSVYFNSGKTMEQEFGKGAMSSNVVTVDSGIEKVIDGAYDGAYESCKMYGKSLVNLFNSKQITPSLHFSSNNDGKYENIVKSNGLIEFDIVGSENPGNYQYINMGKVNVDLLKPNTRYLVLFEEITGIDTVSIRDGNSANTVIDYAKVGGKQYVILTTLSEWQKSNQILYLYVQSKTGIHVKVKNAMIIEYQEGMEQWGLDYFEGLCDVKAPILKNVGKNLFNPMLHKGLTNQGDHYSVDVVQGNAPSIEYDVEPNTEYRLNFDKYGSSSQCWIAVSIDGEYSNNSNTNYRKIFTSNGTGKVTISIGSNGKNDLGHTISNIILCKNDDDISYEDYKTNILETSNEVILRGLPNGVRDTYDCLTGEYIRRVEERDYQESDESDSNVITDLVKTHYELAEPTITMIEPSTTPFAYENGHIILESGHEGQSLLPTLEYQTVVSRSGQVTMIDKTIQQHECKITLLEKMLVQNIIDIEYKNTLLALKLEIDEVI